MWEFSFGRSCELDLGDSHPKLTMKMYDAGWQDIVNIDVSYLYTSQRPRLTPQQYSKRVIEDMKERHASRDRMQWLEMDILDLQLEDESFDLVIDKGMSMAIKFDRG
jgi:hypothetical protein